MREVAPYLVVAWVVAMLGMFPLFGRPRWAVLFIVISGILFLPEAIRNPVEIGPIKFSKHHAIGYAALLGAMLFDTGRLFAIRLSVFDLPALVWCLCPLPSVLTNGSPPDGSSMLWDALSQTWAQTVNYGIPYLLGRMYFTSHDSFRELGLGLITGALVYVPLCLYEIRMSPQLHNMIYGYSQHSFGQTIRFGGYRPMVFMSHGLTLAMFMVTATVFACLMWRGGEFHRSKSAQIFLSRGFRLTPAVFGVTVVLLKSTGALALGFGAGIIFLLGRMTNSRWPLLMLVIVPILYVTVRTNGVWTGDSLIQFVGANIEKGRAQSLEFRFMNENMLVKKALERPWFGWGGWGRNRIFDAQTGKDITVTDGLWIIAMGDRGLIGLLALGGMVLLPVTRFAFRVPPAKYLQSAAATAGVFVLALATIDSLPNVGLASPLYILIAGGLTGLQPIADRNSKSSPIRRLRVVTRRTGQQQVKSSATKESVLSASFTKDRQPLT